MMMIIIIIITRSVITFISQLREVNEIQETNKTDLSGISPATRRVVTEFVELYVFFSLCSNIL